MSDEPIIGPVEWLNRQPLCGTDLIDFLTLRQVCGRTDSRVTKLGDDYFADGRLLLPFVASGLTALVEVGHVALGEPDPASCDMAPVTVTAAGRARYEELCRAQGTPPAPPAPEEKKPDHGNEDSTRWVFDPGDSCSHLLADPTATTPTSLITLCGRELPTERTPTFSIAPSLAVCPICEPPGRLERPRAAFPTTTPP